MELAIPRNAWRGIVGVLLALAAGTLVAGVARGEELFVRGTLRAAGGVPAAGVPVRLVAFPDSYERRMRELGEGSLPASAVTLASGADGRFELAPVDRHHRTDGSRS